MNVEELTTKLASFEGKYQQHTHNKLNGFPINPVDLLGFPTIKVTDATVSPPNQTPATRNKVNGNFIFCYDGTNYVEWVLINNTWVAFPAFLSPAANPAITSTASSSTPTPVVNTASIFDMYILTALATNPTFGAPTGSPTQGRKIIIRVKDDGTSRTLAWNAIYRGSTDIALPTATTISKTLYMGFMYNSTDSTWDLLAKTNGFT